MTVSGWLQIAVFLALIFLVTVGALALVSQGVVQNLKPYDTVRLVEPQQVPKVDANGKPVLGPDGQQVMDTLTEQTIAQGPVASQEIIKEWGTNGGGFFNANSSHPFVRAGDLVVVSAGDFIPSDGEIVEGVASVDESAITGESAPVIREAGGDRSAVTGGTRVLSDRIKVKVTSNPGETFLDRMIALVEGAERQKTPNEIALNILLAGLTIIFLLAVVTLQPFAIYSGSPQTVFVLVSLLVCLIPTTIGGLLSAIGIAGMDRLIQHNVLAMSGRAVEAAGDVNTLLLDKTGTITLGNRQASQFIPAPGVTDLELADAAQLSSLADETPEGRSIVVLAKERYGLRGRELSSRQAEFVPFTAQTRMSGVNLNGFEIRKGAADAIANYVRNNGGELHKEVQEKVDQIARSGGTPLVVAEKRRGGLGVIELKDIVKGGIKCAPPSKRSAPHSPKLCLPLGFLTFNLAGRTALGTGA